MVDIPGSSQLGASADQQHGESNAPAVSVLIVAYNSADCIVDCLAAIPAACTRHSFEILLVDNGDGSTEAIVRAHFPEVRLIPSRGNIGFAAGNNLLARAARSQMLLLVNPDMVALPGSIDALIASSKADREAAAWGGVSLGIDGRPDTGNALSIPSLYELLTVALGRSAVGSRRPAGLEIDEQVDVLMGGLVMFSRTAWDAASGLDERYFLYCEEVDLFYRLRQMGYRFWRIAGAKGVHNAAHGQGFSPRRQLFRTTGIMEFARHHWSRPAQYTAIVLIWIAAAVRVGAGYTVGKPGSRLRKLGESNLLVATRPNLWARGYDPDRGLLAQLALRPLHTDQ